MKDLSEEFKNAVENHHHASNLERVEYRRCVSDRFDGVEYKLIGSVVPVRPIIKVVGAEDGYAIETLTHVTEEDKPRLQAFVAKLPEQDHPAFV